MRHLSTPKSIPKKQLLIPRSSRLSSYLARFSHDLEAFNNTPKLTRHKFKKDVSKEKWIAEDTNPVLTKDAIEAREMLLEVAEELLHAFIPVNTPSPLVDVFWGSFAKILYSAVSVYCITIASRRLCCTKCSPSDT